MARAVRRCAAAALVAATLAAASPPALSQAGPPAGADARARAQQVYVSVYSHVYAGDTDARGRARAIALSTLVSVRNVDASVPLRIRSARYHDTEGRMLRDYATSPVLVPPLATREFFVAQSDVAGGSGASLVIAWEADAPALPPLVEAVHLEVRGSRPISFVTVGRPLDR
ncbi:MAG: DUF3124 domain-containing protein [Burkholderiaceae bacterium]